MNAIFAVLAASAILGFVLGLFFSWVAILVSGLALALLLVAKLLQDESFGFVAGITAIVVCLTVHQIAYLIGARLGKRAQDH
jgi:hypothetical protein